MTSVTTCDLWRTSLGSVCRGPLVGSALLVLLSTAPAHAQFSGFLENYPQLESLDGVSNALFWRASTIEKAYRAIYFDSPELFLDPDSEYRGIQPDAVMTLSDTLKEILETNARERGHEVATQLGPDVLRIRTALTNVYLKRDSRPSRIPIRYTTFQLRTALGRQVSLVNATVEAELLDGESGQRLGVIVVQEGPESASDHNAGTDGSWDELVSTLSQIGGVASRYYADIGTNPR